MAKYKDGRVVDIKTTASHWEMVAAGDFIGINFSAKDLWAFAVKYFEWCDENPVYKSELLRAGERAGEVVYQPIARPYTISGLCLRLGLTREYFYDIARSDEKNDFYFVANRIVEIIYTQKLEAAYVGLYSPIITTKELALGNSAAEKSSPIINISVIGENQKLLTDENSIDIPEDRK